MTTLLTVSIDTTTIWSPYKKAVTWAGRANRKEYWLFHLSFWLMLGTFLTLVAGSLWLLHKLGFIAPLYLGALSSPSALLYVCFGILVVTVLFYFLASFSLQIRRLHDLNLSGWWLGGIILLNMCAGIIDDLFIPKDNIIEPIWKLLLLMVFIAQIYLFGFRKGTPGLNRFGDAPV